MCGMIQILCLELALVIVWLIGVNSFPTIKSKNDYPRITQQNANQREIISRLFSKRTNYDITKILRSRRAVKPTFPSVPTNTDRGILITKTNNMLTVFNGTVLGINDYNSKFVLIERQSYNTSLIRILAVETGLYVAMKENGRVVATKKKDDQSLWIETHELNFYFTYQSYYMSHNYNSSKWFLAIKNNGGIKNGNNTSSGMNSAHFQFVPKQ